VERAQRRAAVKAQRHEAWLTEHEAKLSRRAARKRAEAVERHAQALSRVPAGGDEVIQVEVRADEDSGWEESVFNSWEHEDEEDDDDEEDVDDPCPYLDAFTENGYADREAILTIEREDLDYLGVTSAEHRDRIMQGIQNLKQSYLKKHVLDTSEMTPAEALQAALDELEEEDPDPNVEHAPMHVPRPTSPPSAVPIQPVKMSPYVGVPAVNVSELVGGRGSGMVLMRAAAQQRGSGVLPPTTMHASSSTSTTSSSTGVTSEAKRERMGAKHAWLDRRKRGVLLAVKPKIPPGPDDAHIVMHIESNQRGWVQRKASMEHWAERLSPRANHDNELLVEEEQKAEKEEEENPATSDPTERDDDDYDDAQLDRLAEHENMKALESSLSVQF
jgi:hypothetical protein